MPLLADGLGHRFASGPWLFRSFSFSFAEGNTYALLGPSGSGKSTFLALVAGWTKPAEGSIDRRGLRKVSWVFQNAHGMPRRTAIEHVMLPLLASGQTVQSSRLQASRLLDEFDLSRVADNRFCELSGGEAQRLMLARAVAAEPDLLLIDEPTAQLDTVTSRRVNEVIRSVAGAGRVVLIATHDSETAESCDIRLDICASSDDRETSSNGGAV